MKKSSKASDKLEKKYGIKSIPKNTLIVLDSNEFIFGLTEVKRSCALLIDRLEQFNFILHRVIVQESIKKLEGIHSSLAKEFFQLANEQIRERIIETQIPYEAIKKYLSFGAKWADAHIAAFTEWIGAEYLITENRHFLEEIEFTAFKKMPAEDFLVLTEVN